MSTDPTEPQGGVERRHSREMSLKRGQPPTEVPGYEPERFLGVGAYGEVWVARERNTGRRVAIKFYAHRGGLDWSLLSREVEKLAFLFADRYVVQLLGVGWDAEPPYYIMEYLERGSLAGRLQQGPLKVDEAVAMLRDVAVGLVHAHGKGVLHCDLKPANVLLDQDNKPRLADFGQSRLSHEQIPALGTLFYMAPEQADLEATPDARWDVYALGALLHCMLTGGPPHRTGKVVAEFEQTPHLLRRLARYRRLIEESPPPTTHRQVRGVDRALSEIIEHCLAPDPDERYPNVQAVIDALDVREARRARRPLMVLGAAGPALLLAVVSWFALQGFNAAVQQSNDALTARALESNRFAARYVARTAANELDRRYEAVEQLAGSQRFRQALRQALADDELSGLLDQLGQDDLTEEEVAALQERFRTNAARLQLQAAFTELIPPRMQPKKDNGVEDVASWFFCDAQGLSTVRVPESETIGMGFSWRSYFHGGPADEEKSWRADTAELDRSWRPGGADEPGRARLSATFTSQATGHWIVAVSTPVFSDGPQREFLGVAALTVEVGRFAELRPENREGAEGPIADHQFAVLVDRRKEGKNTGVILQHPLFDQLYREAGSVPERFEQYRVTQDALPTAESPERARDYVDPLAADSQGESYRRRWLAQMEPVSVRGDETGLVVIVQEDYQTAIGSTLAGLKVDLIRYGNIALGLIAVLLVGLWMFATRLSGKY